MMYIQESGHTCSWKSEEEELILYAELKVEEEMGKQGMRSF